ncbi:MAG: hypothetical protein IPK82_20625 [Polyangiaceae bacterium]|nr:hypothetical protein [Polyangiaceae bacterium]
MYTYRASLLLDYDFLFFTKRAGFETLDVRLRMSSLVFRFLAASTTTIDTPCTCGGHGAAFYPS